MKYQREQWNLPYDDGWKRLKRSVMAIAEKWGVQVSMKDKMGRLDIDWEVPADQRYDGILIEIGLAIELASEQTCQFCGARSYVEQVTAAGWIYTLCGDCRELIVASEGPEQERLAGEARRRLESNL